MRKRKRFKLYSHRGLSARDFINCHYRKHYK
jgi:hypothetical protein